MTVAPPEVEFDAEAVVHHDPVRIPFGALPPRPTPPAGSRFSTTFVIGTAGALWFPAAFISGSAWPLVFAGLWFSLMLVSFRAALRR